jgi:hypothetical protein
MMKCKIGITPFVGGNTAHETKVSCSRTGYTNSDYILPELRFPVHANKTAAIDKESI